MNRLLISFSGGETSGYMARRLTADPAVRAHYTEIRTVFANTGEENEKTLVFVDRCDQEFGLGVEWIEAEVHPGERRGSSAKVVTFASAARRGEPFEAVIAKYGIPNSRFPGCTRDLKLRPINWHMANTGWEPGSYDTAVGIRADEFDRVSIEAKARRLVYPCIHHWPTTKPDVNQWWASQPFRLGLKGYEGNCRWCWKKSLRKHLTLLDETPEVFDFPARMERIYGLTGAEFRKEMRPGYRRTFFRDNRSVDDLRRLLAEQKEAGAFVPATDDSVWTDSTLDGREGGCGESCEVFSDDTLAADFSLATLLAQAAAARTRMTELLCSVL